MQSKILTAVLFATTISAQNPGWTCDTALGADWDGYFDMWHSSVADHDACKAACWGEINDIPGDTSKDWCCQSQFTEGSTSVDQCNLYSIATGNHDMRAQPDSDAELYSAWAWIAGVEQDELTIPVEEPEPETPADEGEGEATDDDDEASDDEDTSARVVVSALSLATVAMLTM